MTLYPSGSYWFVEKPGLTAVAGPDTYVDLPKGAVFIIAGDVINVATKPGVPIRLLRINITIWPMAAGELTGEYTVDPEKLDIYVRPAVFIVSEGG